MISIFYYVIQHKNAILSDPRWSLGSNNLSTGNEMLGTNNNFDLKIVTNGTERMVISNSSNSFEAGNIGIPTPKTLLMVADNTNTSDGTYRNWMRVGTYYQQDSDHMYMGLHDNTKV